MAKKLNLGDSKLTFRKGRSPRTWSMRHWNVLPVFLEAKRHAKRFEHPEGGDDGSLLDALRRNWIVTFLKVQFGKHIRTVNP